MDAGGEVLPEPADGEPIFLRAMQGQRDKVQDFYASECSRARDVLQLLLVQLSQGSGATGQGASQQKRDAMRAALCFPMVGRELLLRNGWMTRCDSSDS